MPRFPSELRFWSLLQYSVRGDAPISKLSRDVRSAIKTNGVVGKNRIRAIQLAAQRVAENVAERGVLAECMEGSPALVPMPRSAPLKEGSLWPAAVICQALLDHGIGSEFYPCLRRTAAIRKAAWAARGQRPEPADHDESLALDLGTLANPRQILLVDDIVTRGSSLVGAWPRLTAAFPPIPVRAFALMRTISDGDIDEILSPTAGRISYVHGRLHRDP